MRTRDQLDPGKLDPQQAGYKHDPAIVETAETLARRQIVDDQRKRTAALDAALPQSIDQQTVAANARKHGALTGGSGKE